MLACSVIASVMEWRYHSKQHGWQSTPLPASRPSRASDAAYSDFVRDHRSFMSKGVDTVTMLRNWSSMGFHVDTSGYWDD